MKPTGAGGRTVACTECGRGNRVPVAADGRPRCGSCKAPLPWIADAGDDDFEQVAEKAAPVVLVDLWATWCGPCRMVSPALEQVARELAGRIKLVKVDVDQAPRIAQKFQVQAVPTLILMDRGEVVSRQAGAAPAPALRQWVEQTLRGRR
ncbi:thioredoxin [Streptomyces sp. WMMC940]|uniref:thioredoxin n=1 Tax=Streptomyces sp. WMMC940 TaxID=3015153 RepID=UPI0022B5FB4A|nr:thioredoxin [Streptomyces sp. WMMC940]MCZ7461801.1 thioredoxin [Streptomyces sp. WMMC940]